MVEKNLTSYVFYQSILPKIHHFLEDIKAKQSNEELYIDFSNTRNIDPLVIPILLCGGFQYKKTCGKLINVFVPMNLSSIPLKDFLHSSGFINIAQKYNLFRFDDSIYGGISKKQMSLNRTEVFHLEKNDDNSIDVPRTISTAFYRLNKIAIPFVNTFLEYSSIDSKKEKELYEKQILDVCNELVINALLHGRSFCFLNMQYLNNKSTGKLIKISIADYGIGFKNSINYDIMRAKRITQIRETEGENEEQLSSIQNDLLTIDDADIKRLLATPLQNDELEGCITGLLTRRNTSNYGLFGLYRLIQSYGGRIRIHANDTRIILTDEDDFGLVHELYNDEKMKRFFLEQTSKKRYYKTAPFRGSHIEIEMNLEGVKG